jgi:4-amino-4-deoxy-L-arabinose transferase-like glycosyltransferase
MVRERILKVVLVLFGLLFLAGLIPIWMSLWSRNQADAGTPMLMSLYVALGVFLLLAVRNPSAHRSVIAYAAWANLAHGSVMLVQRFEFPGDRELKFASITVIIIGAILLAVVPKKQPVAEKTPAAVTA